MDIVSKIKQFKKRFDGLVDPSTTRGSSADRTIRLQGGNINRTDSQLYDIYNANGFVENIIDQPAEDATREWITIETNMDEKLNISRMIEKRLESLNFQAKTKDLIRWSRMYPRGSLLYYGFISNTIQPDDVLKDPIEIIHKIDFINVVDQPSLINITFKNRSQPTKKHYNEPTLSLSGFEIHETRYSWLVNKLKPELNEGKSIIATIFDAISAQDSALWSVSSMVQLMATIVFKSDLVANLSPEDKAELLAKIKHIMTTQSALALTSEEDFIRSTYQVEGLKEIFDFIFDNLSGMSKIPKIILLGKAHGVIGAGEYDSLNYFATISRFQKNELQPIIDRAIEYIIAEQSGEIFRALKGNIDQLDWSYKFNPLWVLDPLSQADKELKNSQRDQIDITVGKITPDEARSLDERLNELEDIEISSRNIMPELSKILDMTQPELEVEEEKKESLKLKNE